MKYKHLMNETLLVKLLNTAFKRPQVNVSIWKYYVQTKEHYLFLNNEVTKTRGSDRNKEYLEELFETDLPQDFSKISITEQDFEDYEQPQNPKLWFTAKDITAILGWSSLI